MVEQMSAREIEDLRQCFFYHARTYLQNRNQAPMLTYDELKVALRAIGFVPTLQEIREDMAEHERQIHFAAFLKIVHKHKQKQNTLRDIIEGFKAHDGRGGGTLPVREVEWMLMNYGERLLAEEVQQLFREGRVPGGEKKLNYTEFSNNLIKNPKYSTGYVEPPPDY